MPKPTKAKGADAHRQQKSGGEGGQEPIPERNGGGDEGSTGSLLSGLGVSNKTLLIVGVGAAIAVFLWMKTQNGNSLGGSGDPFDEVLDEEEETPNVDEAGVEEPNIEYDPDDPLSADEEALAFLKGERGGGEDADVSND